MAGPIDDGMFQVGTSSRGVVDNSLIAQVNNALSESGIDTRTFSFTSKSESGSLRTLGSVSDLTKNMMGVVSNPGVANQLHPGALQGKFAGSAMNFVDHGIDLNKFFQFASDEGIDFKDGLTQNVNTLLFDESNFNRAELTRAGFNNSITQQIRPLQTAFHEIGHVASTLSSSDQGVRTSNEAFQQVGDRLSGLTVGSADLPNLSLEYESSFIKKVTQNALEEARAETFSYSILPKTQVGQEYLSHLKSMDFTTNIANGDFLSQQVRGNSFTATAYYHFNERSNNAFQAYSGMGDDWNRHLNSLGINVDHLTTKANIIAAGNFIGATDFGEYSEVYDPLRQGLIEKNRNYILNTHGQEYADMYDDAVKSGSGQRFGVTMSGDVSPPVTGAISAPRVDDTDVSKPTGEPVSPASESVDKAKTARKGPSDLGTPADIKIKPTVDGTKRPTVDIPAPPANGTSTSPNNATASLTTNAPQTSPNPAPPSSGAPPKGKSLMDDAFNTARNVAKGTGNARNLGIIGAATLLGAGAFTMRKKSEQDMQRRMDLQRYGEIK